MELPFGEAIDYMEVIENDLYEFPEVMELSFKLSTHFNIN